MGVLPNTNLGISQIRREFQASTNSMSSIANAASGWLGGNLYAMSTYRGTNLPEALIGYRQIDGGIWDGCNYWDVFCYMEGYSPEGSYCDPDFGYVGAYWTQNGCSMGYSYNSERGCGGGTELTFGGGKGEQIIHGRFTVQLHNVMVPQYTAFCTPVHLSIWVNSIRVACANPNPYDYTDLVYYLYCDPTANYDIEYRVDYGSC